ncbi:MAG: hydroxymethylglutaryl-CoA reductase, degradative [Chloroflexi bacterium RBG_16_48_8]|nr:MAG: hydroxymethylglutaryl-CoA reductase, degradative [Chloroflexi bacterium RBG_16_48_8]
MTKENSSRLPGFYNLSPYERKKLLANLLDLSKDQFEALGGNAGLNVEQADHMIENAIGIFGLPLGIATNFVVNGKDVLIPMVVEEPSVVAGASFMAKLVRHSGGFQAETIGSEMIGQIQVLDISDLEIARDALFEHKEEILAEADKVDPLLKQLGGGARDLEIRIFPETPIGPMLIVHLIFDTRDAMGANTVNTAVERLTPSIERLTEGRVHLRILSNLSDRRLARSRCVIPQNVLNFNSFEGEQVRDGIVEAWAFAAVDPYRAATHNKGIMNGIDAVLIATGNDWRAVEAGAHAYAARAGRYTSLSEWRVTEDGSLEGVLVLPLAVGTVGGATRVHPTAKAALAMMGIDRAQELAEVIASVGLAQNLAALRALATEGIQRGHMSLHARQVAIAAGAAGQDIERVAQRMIDEGTIRIDHARQILKDGKKS